MKKEKTRLETPSRRKYDEEFKSSAIRMVASGRSCSDVARSLGINENLLHKWKSGAGGINTLVSKNTAEGELEGLRRYVRQLETERDILKKALSIFSRAT